MHIYMNMYIYNYIYSCVLTLTCYSTLREDWDKRAHYLVFYGTNWSYNVAIFWLSSCLVHAPRPPLWARALVSSLL